MKLVRVAAAAAFLLLSSSPAFAQSSVDLRPLWNGTTEICCFGTPNTATYGQTVTVVSTASLTSFEFEIGCNVATVARAHVYHWDTPNQRPTGASLFDGAPVTIPGNGTTSYSPVVTTTGGVTLTPGVYVLALSTSQDQTVGTTCQWGSIGTDLIYGGGQFQFLNNGTNFAALNDGATTWSFISQDLAFNAVFAGEVPTMPEWILMILIAATTLTAAWMLRRGGQRFQFSH